MPPHRIASLDLGTVASARIASHHIASRYAYNATILIKRLHSSAYNAATTNTIIQDFEMLLMRCL